jgi:hypothetical protein
VMPITAKAIIFFITIGSSMVNRWYADVAPLSTGERSTSELVPTTLKFINFHRKCKHNSIRLNPYPGRSGKCLQLCRYFVIAWPDAPPGLSSVGRLFPSGLLRTRGHPFGCRLIARASPSPTVVRLFRSRDSRPRFCTPFRQNQRTHGCE